MQDQSPVKDITATLLFTLGVIVALLLSFFVPIGEIRLVNLFLQNPIPYSAKNWFFFAVGTGASLLFILVLLIVMASQKYPNHDEGTNI